MDKVRYFFVKIGAWVLHKNDFPDPKVKVKVSFLKFDNIVRFTL